MSEVYGYKQLEKLTDIVSEVSEYIGYLWYSDRELPEMVNGAVVFSEGIENHFIIEGHLYAIDGSRSISIKEVGGEVIIGEVKWKEIPEMVVLEKKLFLQHAANGFVEFVQAWVPEKDVECENFEVLVPAWIAFTGFIKKEGGQA